MIMLLFGVVVGLTPAAAGSPPTSAEERLVATLEAAIADAPPARLERALTAAREAGLQAEAGAGAWSVEVQREGWDSSFGDEANAAEYYRLVVPWNDPWTARRGRALERGAAEWRGVADHARRLERLSRIGAAWIELAAEMERIEVVRQRLERIDKALALERKRFELGEASGTEVMQVELARATDAARLQSAVVRRNRLAEALRTATGGGLVEPGPGDLEALAQSTRRPPEIVDEERAESGPLGEEARLAAELERRRAELVRKAAWGRPEAEVELERIPAVGGAPSFTALGLRLTVPLRVGKAPRRQVAAAELAAEAAEAEEEARRLQVRERLRTADGAAFTAESVLDELSPTLERLPTSEHSLTEQFRLGAISYLVLIDGLGRLDEVRLQAIESRRDLLVARLDKAVVLDDASLFPLPATDLGGEP